ncbi:hypothetical protein [Marseilla massiliensis]|jgi:hypothetical protein|uniref:hypothetical protein n=1 Tax=Marseilla massiliensis TaxID=1841864 RepID=UPI00258C774B|nr:hypothetical protein [uncultured Mediterranea sp.]
MSFWSSLLKYGSTAARSLGKATGQAGKSAGHAVLHPSQTLRGAGQAMKSAAVGGAAGYVAWEKLTTDKSVARIVSDAVIGESATDTVVESVGDIKEKAGETMDSVSETADRWNGIGNFFQGIFSGNALDMFGSFFGNLAKGNVSGLSLAGLVAAAYLVFGRTGWLGKIAGLLLGLMLIGNNSNVRRQGRESRAGTAQSREDGQEENQGQSTGMRR